MEYEETSMGRVFVLRMEEGDGLNDTVERFAKKKGVKRALVFYLGGIADDSKVVVGPALDSPDAVIPLLHAINGPQEGLAMGTLFPDEAGEPMLHMHLASGREGGATVGCTRAGVQAWLIGEVVMVELSGGRARRVRDEVTGFHLLGM
jgi:predicted DNA-binding protein with PD1-like motif